MIMLNLGCDDDEQRLAQHTAHHAGLAVHRSAVTAEPVHQRGRFVC